MHGRSAIWFLLAVLGLLAVLTLWVEQAVQPPAPRADGSSRHDPDYKLTNFSTLKTDADGNLRNRLEAAEMLHYPDDDSTELIRPRLVMYGTDKPSISFEGDRGRITSDGKEVFIMGNVKVVRAPTGQKGELTLLTDYLHIIPDDEIAKTDRPVTITQAPKTVIRGTGMLYNKKRQTLELYKAVRVHYERPPRPRATSKAAPAKARPAAGNQGGKATGGPRTTPRTATKQTTTRR